jgi:flagellar protein FliO/FliZ
VIEQDILPRLIASLVFVLSLIGLVAWVLRRFPALTRGRGRGGANRLAIIETAIIDPRRRLVLIRRDQREHLLLLGASQDLLIESGIAPPAPNERDPS